MAEPGMMTLAQALQQRAAQYGPLLMPQIQNDEWTNDALQQIQQSGASASKTPLALGGNLLAEAIDQFASRRANQRLSAATQGAQTDYENRLQAQAQASGAMGGNQPAAGGAPTSPTPPVGATGVAGGGGASAGAQPPPPSAPPLVATAAPPAPVGSPGLAAAVMNPRDLDAAVRMAWGEARGEGATGQQAVTGVALNRARETGEPLSQVIAAPHQFSGYNAQSQALDQNSPQYRNILANISPLLNGGAPNPAGSADHFFNPALANPSWGRGPGQMIGQQKFMTLNDQHPIGQPQTMTDAPSPFAQSSAPGGPQSTATASQANPTARPVQIATGPDPSIPAPSAAGPTAASPFPAGPSSAPPSSPGAGNSPPASVAGAGGAFNNGPPTGPSATPQEMQQIQMLRASPYPQDHQAAEQLMQSIVARHMTMLDAPKDMMWGPNGRAVPLPGTETTQLPSSAPGEITQRDKTGALSATAVPNAVQNGQVYDPQTGGYKPLAGLQPTVSGGFMPGSVVSQTPGNAPTVVQQPTFDPEKTRQAFATSAPLQQYTSIHRVAEGFANALQNAAGQNNGLLGTTGVDAVIQSYGLNPRAASAKDLAASMGLGEDIATKVNGLFGKGGATADGMRQMFSIIQSEDQAARAAAQRLQQSDTAAGGPAYAKGVPGEAELMPPPVQMPSFKAFGAPPTPAGNSQQVLQDARAAIARGAPRAAVMQRLQSMGVNAGAL